MDYLDLLDLKDFELEYGEYPAKENKEKEND